jgi:hypothetical protein
MNQLEIEYRYDEQGYRSVYLHFGKIVAVLSENVDYLGDQLRDGCCYLAVPFEAQSVFNRHRANSVTQSGNPLIFDSLRKSLANPDDDFFYSNLDARGVQLLRTEVDVSHDQNIQDLSADSEFQRLNSEVSGCEVS